MGASTSSPLGFTSSLQWLTNIVCRSVFVEQHAALSPVQCFRQCQIHVIRFHSQVAPRILMSVVALEHLLWRVAIPATRGGAGLARFCQCCGRTTGSIQTSFCFKTERSKRTRENLNSRSFFLKRQSNRVLRSFTNKDEETPIFLQVKDSDKGPLTSSYAHNSSGNVSNGVISVEHRRRRHRHH